MSVSPLSAGANTWRPEEAAHEYPVPWGGQGSRAFEPLLLRERLPPFNLLFPRSQVQGHHFGAADSVPQLPLSRPHHSAHRARKLRDNVEVLRSRPRRHRSYLSAAHPHRPPRASMVGCTTAPPEHYCDRHHECRASRHLPVPLFGGTGRRRGRSWSGCPCRRRGLLHAYASPVVLQDHLQEAARVCCGLVAREPRTQSSFPTL